MSKVAPAMMSNAQRRLLFRIKKQRGWETDDLRAACGVGSLKDITRDQATKIINRLLEDRPEHRPRRRRGNPPPKEGTIRPITEEQRDTIRLMFRKLGWTPEYGARVIAKSQKIADWENASLTHGDFALIMNALNAALRRQQQQQTKQRRTA